jgi:uncharacterized membrane protein
MSKKIIEQYFSDNDLKKISEGIGEVEKDTAGEIRLSVQVKKGFFEKKKTPREIALKHFLNLGMHKTKQRTGVLIFILLNDRKFEIIADEGINGKINEQVWDEIENSVRQEFKEGNFLNGVMHCVNLIGAKLNEHFPKEADDTDELPNDVIVK